MAGLAQPLAVVVDEFGGEWSFAHAGDVGLGDGDDRSDARGWDARTCARTTGHCAAGRHEGIGAVVDVEHRCLSRLEQHRGAVVKGAVQQQRCVSNKGTESFCVAEQLADDVVDLDGAAVVHLEQQLVLLLQRALDLLPQDLLVEDVLHADADAVHLVGVGRTDAASGGSDLALAQEAFDDLVDHAVVRSDEVRVRADDEPADVHPAR